MAAHLTDDDRLLAAYMLSRIGTTPQSEEGFHRLVALHMGAGLMSAANYWRCRVHFVQGNNLEQMTNDLRAWANEVAQRRRAFNVVCKEYRSDLDGDELMREKGAGVILQAADEAEP